MHASKVRSAVAVGFAITFIVERTNTVETGVVF
jgi:hypothetical protein